MFDLFSDLFWFDMPSYWFHRPMLERDGWYTTEKDGKLIVLLNTLGVDKKDLTVEVKSTKLGTQTVCVSGTTKNTKFDKDFSVNMKFTVREPIEELVWDVENGFLTLEISFQEPVKPSVKITRK